MTDLVEREGEEEKEGWAKIQEVLEMEDEEWEELSAVRWWQFQRWWKEMTMPPLFCIDTDPYCTYIGLFLVVKFDEKVKKSW